MQQNEIRSQSNIVIVSQNVVRNNGNPDRPESSQFLVPPINPNQNQVININDQPNDLANIELDDISHYRSLLLEFVFNIIFSHAFSILFASIYLFNLHFAWCFIPLFLWDIYDLALICKHRREIRLNNKLKKRYFLMIMERYSVIFMKIMIILYFQFDYFLIIYLLIPLIFYCFIRCVTYGLDKNSGECHTMIDFLAVSYRLFVLIQGITICCRLDAFIDWEWKEVFWSYWVFFSILIGIDFGLILMTLSKFCNCFIGSVDWVELKGLFWFTIVSLSFTISSCLLNMGTASYLDNNSKEIIQQFLYFILSSLVTNLAIIVLFKSSLVLFLKGVNSEEESESKKDKQSLNNNQSFAVPKFLSKFSSTYFKKVDIDTPQLNELQKNKKNKKKLKQKKFDSLTAGIKGKPIRSNSFNEKYIFEDIELNTKLKSGQELNTKSTYNDLGIFSKHEIPLERTSLKNIKDFNDKFVQLSTEEKIPGEIITFKSQTKDHINIIKPEKIRPPLMLNTQIMDIKINANELKQIKNIDMCKSATLPQTLSPFSSPIKLPPKNFNNNQIKDAIIEDESPGKKSNMEKSNTMCLVCFDKVPDAVFMECGHGGVCYECAFELFKATGECYLCRQEIKQILKIDVSMQGDYLRVIEAAHIEFHDKEIGNSRMD